MSVSCTAKAVWIVLLMLMAKADPPGHLINAAGEQPSDDILAKSVCCKTEEIQPAIKELIKVGAFRREFENSGHIVCPRILEEEENRKVSKENGKRAAATKEEERKAKKKAEAMAETVLKKLSLQAAKS